MIDFQKPFIILFMLSLLLYIPLTVQEQSFTVEPGIKKTIFFRSNQPKIVISSDISITVSYSYFNLADNKTKSKGLDIEVNLKKTLDTNKPGLYVFEITSSGIATIKIKGSGVYITSILISIVLIAVNLSYYIIKEKLIFI